MNATAVQEMSTVRRCLAGFAALPRALIGSGLAGWRVAGLSCLFAGALSAAPAPAGAPESQKTAATVVPPSVFFIRPVESEFQGASTGYGRATNIWQDAVRGGASQVDTYFHFRFPSIKSPTMCDLVFYDETGRGYFIPVEWRNTSPTEATFIIEKNGRVAGQRTQQRLDVTLRWPENASQIDIVMHSVTTDRLLFFKDAREWTITVRLQPASAPAAVVEAAQKITVEGGMGIPRVR